MDGRGPALLYRNCGQVRRAGNRALKKAAALDIAVICPLHGPVLKENLGYYIDLYSKWASYTPEKRHGYCLCVGLRTHRGGCAPLGDKLWENGGEVKLYDLARCDMSKAVSDAFAYSNLVLASVTYNGDVFPCMKEFINALCRTQFPRQNGGKLSKTEAGRPWRQRL